MSYLLLIMESSMVSMLSCILKVLNFVSDRLVNWILLFDSISRATSAKTPFIIYSLFFQRDHYPLDWQEGSEVLNSNRSDYNMHAIFKRLLFITIIAKDHFSSYFFLFILGTISKFQNSKNDKYVSGQSTK